jgi:hypothetical protein
LFEVQFGGRSGGVEKAHFTDFLLLLLIVLRGSIYKLIDLLHVIIVNRKRLCGFYAKTGGKQFLIDSLMSLV